MALFDRIGDALIKARTMAGYKTRVAAADAAGVPQSQLSRWEKHINQVRLDNLERLLEAWGFESLRDFGQLVDELNGVRSRVFERITALEHRIEASSRGDDAYFQLQLRELRSELGLPEKSEKAYDLELHRPADPEVVAQINEELRVELEALRLKHESVQRYIGGILSAVLAEVDNGTLSESTAAAIVRPGGRRTPAESGGDKPA